MCITYDMMPEMALPGFLAEKPFSSFVENTLYPQQFKIVGKSSLGGLPYLMDELSESPSQTKADCDPPPPIL